MQTVPYLTFGGTCREAFQFYASVLGGTPEIMSHAESPMADQVPADWADRVMHAYLAADGAVLMGSDMPPGESAGGNAVWVSLHVASPHDADRVFAALAEGGTVSMPIAETFWSPRFGMLTDRFGISWMVNCAPPTGA